MLIRVDDAPGLEAFRPGLFPDSLASVTWMTSSARRHQSFAWWRGLSGALATGQGLALAQPFSAVRPRRALPGSVPALPDDSATEQPDP